MKLIIFLFSTMTLIFGGIIAQDDVILLLPLSEDNLAKYSFVHDAYDGSFYNEERNDSMNATASASLMSPETKQNEDFVIIGTYTFTDFSIHFFNTDIADSSIIDPNYSIIDSGVQVIVRFDVGNENTTVTNLDQLIRVCLADELENVTDEKEEAKIIRRNRDEVIASLDKGILFFAKRHIQSYGASLPVNKEIDLTQYMPEAALKSISDADAELTRTAQIVKGKKSYSLIKNLSKTETVPDSDVVKQLEVSEVSEFDKKEMILLISKYTFKNKVAMSLGEGLQEELTIITRIQEVE